MTMPIISIATAITAIVSELPSKPITPLNNGAIATMNKAFPKALP